MPDNLVKLHFINVGKGNCTILDLPSGRLSVIDIDDSRALSEDDKKKLEEAKAASLSNPIDYILEKYPKESIFRFILSHPDMDHMSGIKILFDKKKIFNFWDPQNNKPDPGDWKTSPYDKADWDYYQKLKDKKIEGVTILSPLRNETADCCWVQDGIKILSPTKELVGQANKEEDWNISSYVLMLECYGVKVLFGGDVSKEVWADIIKAYGKDYLKSDILLAPHHGSENNISSEILDIIKPRLVIVSVAAGVDYAGDLYSKYGRVLSTKFYGNITVTIKDNKEVSFRTQFQNYSNAAYILNERASYYKE